MVSPTGLEPFVAPGPTLAESVACAAPATRVCATLPSRARLTGRPCVRHSLTCPRKLAGMAAEISSQKEDEDAQARGLAASGARASSQQNGAGRRATGRRTFGSRPACQLRTDAGADVRFDGDVGTFRIRLTPPIGEPNGAHANAQPRIE